MAGAVCAATLGLTSACGGATNEGAASPTTPSSSAPPAAATAAPLLPAGFPARTLSYDLTKQFVGSDGLAVFPGHYELAVSPDGSAVLSADGHDYSLVIHAEGIDRVRFYGEGGATSLGDFRWGLVGRKIRFSDDRPGLETGFDRYFLASSFTVR